MAVSTVIPALKVSSSESMSALTSSGASFSPFTVIVTVAFVLTPELLSVAV